MKKKAAHKKIFGFKSLSTRINVLLVVSIALSITITASVSLISMSNMINSISEKSAVSSLNAMKSEIDYWKEYSKNSAEGIAGEDRIVDCFIEENDIKLAAEISKLSKVFGVKNIAITDKNGVVLASTHESQKKGENISSYTSVNKALSGESSTQIETGTSVRYAVFAGAPIYDRNNSKIGTVSVIYDLSDETLVDDEKTELGSEFTIFVGDERLNTTIIKDGKRAVGTKLDSKISKILLQDKKQYIGKAKILGENYMTIYSPIFSEDNSQVTGILYAGNSLKEVEDQNFKDILVIILLAVIALAANSLIGSTVIKKTVKKPLEKIVKATKAIETGEVNESVLEDLKEIKANDEIGALSKSMQEAVSALLVIADDANMLVEAAKEKDLTVSLDVSRHKGIYRNIVEVVQLLCNELSNVVMEIKVVAENIQSGSEHVSNAAQALAQGTTEQASASQELSATITEISEQIKLSSENAASADVLSNETGEKVSVSNQYMNDLVDAMQEINSKSVEINKIIKTIDDIAFQTNILALNAAVEAARAGAAGKGFAVVSDEVRNLANKSSDAAKNTTLLIENSVTAINKGSSIAEATEKALRIVVEKTNSVTELVNHIAAAADIQNQSISQINMGIDQISSVVQTNAATAEETAASSEELAGQAQSLLQLVMNYKIN